MSRKPLLLGALALAAGALFFALSTFDGFRAEPAAPESAVDSMGSVPEPAPDREPALSQSESPDARSLTAPVAPVAPEPTSPPALFVRGKVVDSRRFPAGGVEVRLIRASGAVDAVLTDAAGAFAIGLPARPAESEVAQVWASRGDETAVEWLSLRGTRPSPSARPFYEGDPASDVNVGTLALRAGRALRIEVLEAGRAAPEAEVHLRRPRDGTVLWRGRSDAQGLLTTPPLPAGCFDLEAVLSASAGRARAFLPEESLVRIELAPSFEGTITVVEKGTGAPLPGATVRLSELVWVPSSQGDNRGMGAGEYTSSLKLSDGEQTTDAAGSARFARLTAGRDHRVYAQVPGHASYPPRGSGGERIGVDKPALRIELERLDSRTVRWPIAAGEVPPPPEGSRVVLKPHPGSFRELPDGSPAAEREGLVQDGQIVLEGFLDGAMFLGIAPDGSIGRLTVRPRLETGEPVSFRKPRTIEILVRDAAGAPVEGALTESRNQGNNPLGPPARTDAGGSARMTGLYGELANVSVRVPSMHLNEWPAGSVDITSADARLEFTLPSTESFQVCLEVRIDGSPQLPPEYSVRSIAGVAVREERPERGELALRVTPPENAGEVALAVTATGYLPAGAKVAVVRDGSEQRAVVQLVRGATLTARVSRPAAPARVELQIQGWKPEQQTWGPVQPYFNGLHTPNGPGGSFQFFGLAPGRYRVVDETSKVESDAVDILEGETEATVALDLASLEWVAGRIELPDAAELPSVRVLSLAPRATAVADWLPGSTPPEGSYVAKDGTFKVRVNRGVRTKLRAWHPWLAPADPGGEIEVDSGREGVVLSLVAGDQVRLSVPQLAALRWFKSARVAVYGGAVAGEPRAWLHAPLVDGALRFTGVPRGRATLWIDPGRELAPLVLADVEIGAGVTDLGEASFIRGSCVRVRIKVKEGEAAERIFIHARREAPPVLDRQFNSSGEVEPVLSGLEAGTYKLSFSSVQGRSGGPADQSVELDGVQEVVIDWN